MKLTPFLAALVAFSASILPLEAAEEKSEGKFSATASMHGITFKVESENRGGTNTVTVTPKGLAKDNSPVTTDASGPVTGIEVADINSDGSPEIYIYVKGPTGLKRGGLLGFSANRKRSLSQISLPPLEESPKHAAGYRGRDEFAVVEGIIARRFPIFPTDTSKTEPTGKIRQLQYKLVPGEAGWRLKVDRVTEF